MISLVRMAFMWAVYLVLVFAQSPNLLPRDSTELAENTLSLDDEGSLWNLNDAGSLWTSSNADPLTSSNDLSSSVFDLSANQIAPDIEPMSDMVPSSSSDKLFASDLPDEIATLPACDYKRSLPDNVLQARLPDSCQNPEGRGNLNLPSQLFQDPVGYLRDKIRVPPTGQSGSGDQNRDDDPADERSPTSDFTDDLKRDEKRCPVDHFGPSSTPVCSNPLTGWYDPTEPNGQIELFNIIPFDNGICLAPAELFCCAVISIRDFFNQEREELRMLLPELQYAVQTLRSRAYDASYCWKWEGPYNSEP